MDPISIAKAILDSDADSAFQKKLFDKLDELSSRAPEIVEVPTPYPVVKVVEKPVVITNTKTVVEQQIVERPSSAQETAEREAYDTGYAAGYSEGLSQGAGSSDPSNPPSEDPAPPQALPIKVSLTPEPNSQAIRTGRLGDEHNIDILYTIYAPKALTQSQVGDPAGSPAQGELATQVVLELDPAGYGGDPLELVASEEDLRDLGIPYDELVVGGRTLYYSIDGHQITLYMEPLEVSGPASIPLGELVDSVAGPYGLSANSQGGYSVTDQPGMDWKPLVYREFEFSDANADAVGLRQSCLKVGEITTAGSSAPDEIYLLGVRAADALILAAIREDYAVDNYQADGELYLVRVWHDPAYET